VQYSFEYFNEYSSTHINISRDYNIALLIASLLHSHPALAGAHSVVKILYECLPAAVYNNSLMYF